MVDWILYLFFCARDIFSLKPITSYNSHRLKIYIQRDLNTSIKTFANNVHLYINIIFNLWFLYIAIYFKSPRLSEVREKVSIFLNVIVFDMIATETEFLCFFVQ